MTQQRVRVATYNLHGCIGTDGVLDIHRVAEVIRRLNAHVVGVQEVHASAFATKATADLHDLSVATGLRAVEGSIRPGHRGAYGNAVLTSLPVLSHRLIDLSVSGREPRGALEVYLQAPGGRMRVVTAHLGLAPWERRAQSRRLVDILAHDNEPADVTVLLGDLNEWYTFGRPLRWLHEVLGRSAHIATFPSMVPLLALDRIWVRPRASLLRSCRVWNGLTRKASDHLPLQADIVVKAAG